MPHKPSKYLTDMLRASRTIEEYCRGRSEEAFLADGMLRSAVERQYMILGEALFKLNREHPTVAPLVPEHTRIIGLRHILVHGYDAVDPQVLWLAVQAKLPQLVAELERILLEELGSA